MNLLGLDIGGTKTSVCLGDEHGVVRAARRMPTRVPDGPDLWHARLLQLIRELLAEQRLAASDLDGLGVAAPGPMSVARGLLLDPPNMSTWHNVPVVRWLGDALGRPVFINNDANAGGLAEYHFGACRGTPDLVFLTLSTGLGAGVIVGGRLLQGACDLGGEVGHHVLDANGPPCPCGLRGCLELFCGGKNVADRLRAEIVADNIATAILDQAGGDPAHIDFRAFADAARQGDAYAVKKWAEFVEHLAHGIGTLLMLYNPSAIVMGTIAVHTGEFLLAPLRQAVRRYAWPSAVDACRLLPSSLAAQGGNLGALAVAITGLR